jgi:hypothetical protein
MMRGLTRPLARGIRDDASKRRHQGKRDCAVSKALAGVEEINLEAKPAGHAG